MRVLVCGSRGWRAYLPIRDRLFELPPRCEVLHGAAEGADLIAASTAFMMGHDVRAFPAKWKKLGKRAGIIRNLEMLDQDPDLVLAFWDGKSRGTLHTITEARKRGIPVEVHGGAEAEGRAPQSKPETSRSGGGGHG